MEETLGALVVEPGTQCKPLSSCIYLCCSRPRSIWPLSRLKCLIFLCENEPKHRKKLHVYKPVSWFRVIQSKWTICENIDTQTWINTKNDSFATVSLPTVQSWLFQQQLPAGRHTGATLTQPPVSKVLLWSTEMSFAAICCKKSWMWREGGGLYSETACSLAAD